MNAGRVSSIVVLLAALVLVGAGCESSGGESAVADAGLLADAGETGAGDVASGAGDVRGAGAGDVLIQAAAYEQNGGTVSEADTGYATTVSDESAVRVYGGGSYALTNGVVQKSGDTSNADSSNFYGLNAIVLAEDESDITLTNCSLSADSEGSNGAFAYGEGSSVTLYGCDIATTGDSARGVDATYGGKIFLYDSRVSTQGDHCGALASDRYENDDPPEITADNVVATTAGDGSPGIYCTGTFAISNSTLTATGSEAAAIEGLNSITLTDSDISGLAKWGVIIYQSMSGDSSVGTGTFTMTGGSLTNGSTGPVFVVCNTSAVIALEGVDIASSGDVLLRATDSSSGDDNINPDWGSAGGDVAFQATDQALAGTVSCNAKSSMTLTLSGSSAFAGDIVVESGGDVALTLEDDATWVAAADSVLQSLVAPALSAVDGEAGVTIQCDGAEIAGEALASGSHALASGATLVVNGR